MVALAIVVQRCATHARASPNVFCRALQELHKCLIPVVEEGDLFNTEMEILMGARKGPMAPTSLERVPSPTPRAEEPTSAPAPNPPSASKLEGAASPEKQA